MGITIGYSNLSSNLISSLSAYFKGLMDYNVYAYIDGVRVSTIPLKTDGYAIDTSHGNGTGIECTDNATASWDNNNWAITIGNTSTSGTRCNIYFKTKKTLYNVLKNEAAAGTYAREYTGNHQDSMDASKSTKKIYYYYGSNNTNGTAILDKNNVLFAGQCWQMIRTTDTGGVKMIYNGEAENNQCLNTRGDHEGYASATTIDLKGNYYYG